MFRTLSLIASLAILFTVATEAPAAAQRYQLSVGTTARWLHSGSMDALTDDNLAAFSLAGAVGVERLGLLGFDLSIDGALDTGSVAGTTFQTIETETAIALMTLGVRAQRALTDRWQVQGRAALGGARVRVELTDRYAGSGRLTDSAYTPAAYLGAGTELILARRNRADGVTSFALGLSAELGYLLAAAADMSPRPPQPDDGVIRIPEMSTSLGELDVGGASLRFAVVSHF